MKKGEKVRIVTTIVDYLNEGDIYEVTAGLGDKSIFGEINSNTAFEFKCAAGSVFCSSLDNSHAEMEIVNE